MSEPDDLCIHEYDADICWGDEWHCLHNVGPDCADCLNYFNWMEANPAIPRPHNAYRPALQGQQRQTFEAAIRKGGGLHTPAAW